MARLRGVVIPVFSGIFGGTRGCRALQIGDNLSIAIPRSGDNDETVRKR